MKNASSLIKLLCFAIFLLYLPTFSFASEDIFPPLPSAYDIFIGKEPSEKRLPRFIKHDYIRDTYKRALPNLEERDNLSFFQKYPVELHVNTLFSYGIPFNTFNIRDTYLSIGQTFHNKYFAITGFLTAYGFFDTHDPSVDYGFVKERYNAGLYDGGVQAVFLDHILISARGRATSDINTTTFMLMPHYYDPTINPAYYERVNSGTSSYSSLASPIAGAGIIPQTLNGAGIRVGFIGDHYELTYSQGDFRHSIPKALLARFTMPNIDMMLLYQHENRNKPDSYAESLFSSLVQASFTFRFPFLNKKLWVNAIAEYTWRQHDAHYVRLEQAIEFHYLNVALREIVMVKDTNAKVFFEYAIYGKFEIDNCEFLLGFQGTTEGRYYIAGSIKY